MALKPRHPDQLSRRTAATCRSGSRIAPKPKILLMDEPFANLDALRKFQLAQDLTDLLRAENACAVLITHDRQDALSFSDRIAIMGQGKRASEFLQTDNC